MSEAAIQELLARAEAAGGAGAVGQGLALAEEAWQQVPPQDTPRRQRTGLLLAQLAYRAGALGRMLEVTLQILPLLRAGGATPDLIDLLRMACIAGCETGRFDVALSSAQEAHRLALELGDMARVSLAVNALGCFFDRTGDSWQAERVLREALALARQQTDAHAIGSALNNLAAALIGKFYMLRDAVPLEEARQALRDALPLAHEAVALTRQAGEPFHHVFTLGNLGEILVNLEQADAARAVLTPAIALAREHGFAAQYGRIGVSWGELAWVEGRPQAAWDELLALSTTLGESEPRNTLLRLHHVLWRCAATLHQPAQALAHLEHYLRLERQRTMLQLRAQSDLFVTRMEAETMRQEARRHDARATALEADARRDQLTGLGNRREVERRWPELLQRVRQQGTPLSVAMLDLDHFKQVNDRHGHAVGDRVLVALAAVLRAGTRGSDLVARVGGEEFLLALPDAGPEGAAEICERLRAQVEAGDWQALAPGLRVTLSVGLTSTPPYDAETLSLRADAALYRAKEAGRNRVVQM